MVSDSPTIAKLFTSNNDALIVQVKPVIKQTTRCSFDLTGETSIDNELRTDELNVEVNVEINFNPWEKNFKFSNFKSFPNNALFVGCWFFFYIICTFLILRFQQILELKLLMLDHLNLDKMFVCELVDENDHNKNNNNDDKQTTTTPNRMQEFDIISATELFQVYYVLWLGTSQTDKTVSKVDWKFFSLCFSFWNTLKLIYYVYVLGEAI